MAALRPQRFPPVYGTHCLLDRRGCAHRTGIWRAPAYGFTSFPSRCCLSWRARTISHRGGCTRKKTPIAYRRAPFRHGNWHWAAIGGGLGGIVASVQIISSVQTLSLILQTHSRFSVTKPKEREKIFVQCNVRYISTALCNATNSWISLERRKTKEGEKPGGKEKERHVAGDNKRTTSPTRGDGRGKAVTVTISEGRRKKRDSGQPALPIAPSMEPQLRSHSLNTSVGEEGEFFL